DTSIDVAAELGIGEIAVRAVLERAWRLGIRGANDDLADLLKPEPVEPATLSQALADLPRLLDPQNSRRRTTGSFRAADRQTRDARDVREAEAARDARDVPPAQGPRP